MGLLGRESVGPMGLPGRERQLGPLLETSSESMMHGVDAPCHSAILPFRLLVRREECAAEAEVVV